MSDRRQTHIAIRPNWRAVVFGTITGFFAGILLATSVIAMVVNR